MSLGHPLHLGLRVPNLRGGLCAPQSLEHGARPLRPELQLGLGRRRSPVNLPQVGGDRVRRARLVELRGVEGPRAASGSFAGRRGRGRRAERSPSAFSVGRMQRRVRHRARAYGQRGRVLQSEKREERGAFHRVWRRGSESNRRRRLCRPLHDHSATPPGGRRARNARRSNEKGEPFQRCRLSLGEMERETSLELATSTLARLRSTN